MNKTFSRKKALFVTLFTLFMGILIALSSIFDYKGRDAAASLKRHKKFTLGKIVSYKLPGYKDELGNYIYTFTVKDINYDGEFIALSFDSAFFKTRFIVVYDSTNPAINDILVFPKDFREYNIPFPDSLKWDIPYY